MCNSARTRRMCTVLTVRLLETSTRSGSTELLGLIPPGVSDQQATIELDQNVLDLLLALLVDVLLIVGHERL